MKGYTDFLSLGKSIVKIETALSDSFHDAKALLYKGQTVITILMQSCSHYFCALTLKEHLLDGGKGWVSPHAPHQVDDQVCGKPASKQWGKVFT